MGKDITKIIGNNIATHRKLLNLTQTQLGEKIGKSQAVISAWEKGTNDPGAENIILLSEFFGISPSELFGYNPDGVYHIPMPDASMEPEIHQGDLLTVQEGATVLDGDTVIADTSKEKGIIRRLFHVGVQIMLLSVNPTVPPIGTHFVNIRGKVTDIHRKL